MPFLKLAQMSIYITWWYCSPSPKWSNCYLGRVKQIWYLSPMRAAKVQASLRIRAVSPEPPLLAHTSSESRWTFRQKARSPAPLNGWACAVKICHGGMLEDTNSLDAATFKPWSCQQYYVHKTGRHGKTLHSKSVCKLQIYSKNQGVRSDASEVIIIRHHA